MEVARPLRVAVVAPPFYEIPPSSYGGIERVCYSLVEGLVERGHEVILVAAGAARTRARFVATFTEAQLEGTDSETATEVLHAARASAALEALELDLVHDHTRAGPLAAASRAAPTLVTVHVPLAGPDAQADVYEALGRRVALVALSEAQRRAAPQLNWAGTVPNGIPVAEYPFRADKEDFLLFLGRMSRHKGVHLAIAAARQVSRRLVVAGSWTIASERAYFDEEVRPSLGEGVEWVGEVSGRERTDLLSRASCLLAPVQYEEPFGLVMVEALACGTPVVGLRAGSVPEIVQHAETGVVCDDPAELADAIGAAERLDPARCRADAAERFGVETMVERYEAIYRRLAGEAEPTRMAARTV